MTRILSTPRQRVHLQDILADHEPPYRSRGEAQVGRLLDHYGIPFQYEAPLQLYDREQPRTWHPDFTLPRDYKPPLILEYAGMPDRPDHFFGMKHKAQTYRTNGIDAVFILPSDLQGSAWPERLYEKVRDAYIQRRSPMRYQAMSSTRVAYAMPRQSYHR